MSLTLIDEDGNAYVANEDNAGPFQFSPEGYNTGLSTNSVPLSQWDGTGGSFSHIYRTQPMIAALINKLTRQVARLPLKVYEGDSGQGKKRVTSGALFDAVKTPARRHRSISLKQWMIFPALMNGNGAVEKVRRRPGTPPTGFRPLNWRLLTPHWIDDDPEQPIDYWVYDPVSGRRVIQPEDLIHLAWHPPAGSIGVSPLKQLGVTLRIERAAQIWQQALLRNSARPSGGFSMPDAAAGQREVQRELRRELREDIARLQQGMYNAGRPILLPPGAKWEAFSYDAQEAELINQRKLDWVEACAVYDMPPPLVAILDDATFSNITEQHKMLYGPVLGPWLSLLEECFTAQVCDDEPAFEGQWVEYDLREVLRGDPVKEAVAFKTDLASGRVTVNEGRDADNRPRFTIPAADEPLIGANNLSRLATLDEDGQDVPPPEPDPPPPQSDPEAGA